MWKLSTVGSPFSIATHQVVVVLQKYHLQEYLEAKEKNKLKVNTTEQEVFRTRKDEMEEHTQRAAEPTQSLLFEAFVVLKLNYTTRWRRRWWLRWWTLNTGPQFDDELVGEMENSNYRQFIYENFTASSLSLSSSGTKNREGRCRCLQLCTIGTKLRRVVVDLPNLLQVLHLYTNSVVVLFVANAQQDDQQQPQPCWQGF